MAALPHVPASARVSDAMFVETEFAVVAVVAPVLAADARLHSAHAAATLSPPPLFPLLNSPSHLIIR